MNLLIAGILGLFALSMVIGIIFGFIRGSRKAFLRLLTIAGAFVLALLFTPVISNAFFGLAKEHGGPYVTDWVMNETGSDALAGLVSHEIDLVGKTVLMFANPLLFIGVFIAFWILSYLLFIILHAVLKKRGRGSKRRGLGLLWGVVSGFIMFFAIYIPVNGYLSVANQLNKIENESGRPVVNAFLEDLDLGDYKIDLKDYNNNALPKILGIGGFDKACFNFLSTARVSGHTLRLTPEVNAFLNIYGEFASLGEGVDLFDDPVWLKALVVTVFESKLVNAAVDGIIDYGADNPSVFAALFEAIAGDGGNSSVDKTSGSVRRLSEAGTEDGDGVNIFDQFLNEEVIVDILKVLQSRGIKAELLAVCDALIAIHGIVDLGAIELDAFADIAPADVDKFVDAVFNVRLIRAALPHLIPVILQPVADAAADTIGMDKFVIGLPGIKYDNDDAWDAEKTVFKNILKSFSSMKDLLDLYDNPADTPADQIDKISVFLKGDPESGKESLGKTLGTLLNSIKVSRLFGELYDGLMEFDEGADEYYFIVFFNKLALESTLGTGDKDLAGNSLRALFSLQEQALISDAAGNKNIDFVKVDWIILFDDMAETMDIIMYMNLIQSLKDVLAGGEIVRDAMMEMIKNLKNMNPVLLQAILNSLVPEGSGVKVPNVGDVKDFDAEAELFGMLFDYQEAVNDPDKVWTADDQDDLNKMVDLLAKSEFILPLLDSADVPINNLPPEKEAMIDEAIEEAVKNNPGLAEDTEKLAAIKKLLTVSAAPGSEG